MLVMKQRKQQENKKQQQQQKSLHINDNRDRFLKHDWNVFFRIVSKQQYQDIEYKKKRERE